MQVTEHSQEYVLRARLAEAGVQHGVEARADISGLSAAADGTLYFCGARVHNATVAGVAVKPPTEPATYQALVQCIPPRVVLEGLADFPRTFCIGKTFTLFGAKIHVNGAMNVTADQHSRIEFAPNH